LWFLARVVFGAIEYIPFPDQTMVRKIGPSYETKTKHEYILVFVKEDVFQGGGKFLTLS